VWTQDYRKNSFLIVWKERLVNGSILYLKG